MSADDLAATTEVEAPAPDGSESKPKGAESAPAVTDTDEVNAEAKTGFSKRIDELTRNWREEQRRNEALMQLLQQDRAQAKPVAQPVEAPPSAGKTLADFQYDEGKYQAHLFAEARKEAVRAAREELQREQETQSAAQLDAEFGEREQTFAKDLPDYMDVTRNPSLAISETMAQTAKESENGPAILYHLAKNPSLAASIARLPPLQQAREIGRIEVKLTEKPKVPVVSAAPPPAPKIEASDAKVEKSPHEMTPTEFSKWRRKYMK